MSSLEHDFNTAGESATTAAPPEPVKGGWWNGLSLRGKLGLAVFGNTMVLALIALIMLGGTWQLGQGGHAQAVRATGRGLAGRAAAPMTTHSDEPQVAPWTRR